ncbi:hypothetical protein F5Y17DRAFT_466256 [Xylariaceae sp. FL0594]|nr:hypothetical protein F5Y17DRAFT_466256 [Xylariaceae sp. FL0594]
MESSDTSDGREGAIDGIIGIPEPREQVLLTAGGSGFIASHILDTLLRAGLQVVVTARSEEKGQRIVQSVSPFPLSYVVVEEIEKPGVFDKIFTSGISFDYVVHTASPYHVGSVKDPTKEFLEPAIQGTRGLLDSIHNHAPTVKRLVITSSSAAILNPFRHAAVYDESHWSPVKWEDAMEDPERHAYRVSKVLAEKTAWDYVHTRGTKFDLVVINPTYVFGPIQGSLPSLEAMNTSNHRIRDMMQGKMKDALEPTAPVFTFVDVRDVAVAHLRALELALAGNHRFYVVAGHFSNKRIADIIRRRFPQFADRLPAVDDPSVVDDLPEDVYRFDNTKSKEILGMEYKGLEESVITQTITYPGFTTTALVTLGPAEPTSSTPAQTAVPTTGASSDSNGVSSASVGIIVGSILGVILLALLICLCCIARRRMLALSYRDDDEIVYTVDEITEIRRPHRAYWPQFPRSISPPVVATYVATPIPRMYTATHAARGSDEYYIVHD